MVDEVEDGFSDLAKPTLAKRTQFKSFPSAILVPVKANSNFSFVADMIKLRLGIRKDWPLLRSILNKAMKKISAQEMIELRKKWFSSHVSISKKVSLTLEEQKWLLTHSTVRLGDDFSWPPFSFLDSEGRYSGMSSGYVDFVSKRLGIEMIPEYDISWSQALEKVKKKD